MKKKPFPIIGIHETFDQTVYNTLPSIKRAMAFLRLFRSDKVLKAFRFVTYIQNKENYVPHETYPVEELFRDHKRETVYVSTALIPWDGQIKPIGFIVVEPNGFVVRRKLLDINFIQGDSFKLSYSLSLGGRT